MSKYFVHTSVNFIIKSQYMLMLNMSMNL